MATVGRLQLACLYSDVFLWFLFSWEGMETFQQIRSSTLRAPSPALQWVSTPSSCNGNGTRSTDAGHFPPEPTTPGASPGTLAGCIQNLRGSRGYPWLSGTRGIPQEINRQSLGRPGPEWTGLVAGFGDGGGTRAPSTMGRHRHTQSLTLTLTLSGLCNLPFLNEPSSCIATGTDQGYRNHSCIIWTPCPSHPPQLRAFPEDNALLLCLTFRL